jgi:hypothetical protein
MLFLQTIKINLVLTKSSCPKRHAVAFTAPNFASFQVCHTDLGGGGGGRQVERACKKEQVFFHGKNASVYSMIVSLTEF